ncbi:MAG: hypothetical protein JNK82_10105 [Myxococcaceae bacterium]|nr:hypothetical protein [Myxococcaceae bacterium]
MPRVTEPSTVKPAAGSSTTKPAGGAFPTKAGLGVSTIHRYTEPRVTPSVIAITVYTPVPTSAVPGKVLDTNSKPFAEKFPERFIIDDGGLNRIFTGVDLRKGSLLDKKLNSIVNVMPKDTEGRLQFIAREVNRLIKWTAGSSANDGRDEFEWDKKAPRPGPAAGQTHQAAAYDDISAPPRSTGESMDVVGLEKYLEAGEGYCIQKALLAACLLNKLDIPFRLVNGAVSQGPGRSVGHTWVELEDGRVLDAAWSTLTKVTKDHPNHSDWFKLGGSYRFANQKYPYLALT